VKLPGLPGSLRVNGAQGWGLSPLAGGGSPVRVLPDIAHVSYFLLRSVVRTESAGVGARSPLCSLCAAPSG